MAKADSDFAALARKGVPAAFIEYYDANGVAFTPQATNGKKYWRARKDFPAQLIWQPVYAMAARDGDLGVTMGPWELKKTGDETAAAYGHYVTIWKKENDDSYRVALDVGIDHGQPTDAPPRLELIPPNPIAGTRALEESRRLWQKAERSFLAAAREDVSKAILDFAAEDLRVMRDGSFPAVGVTPARLMLEAEHGKLTFTFGGSGFSSSGDLAYTYGNYEKQKGNITERGIYLMLWRLDLNGDWKLSLDLQKKRPPNEKA